MSVDRYRAQHRGDRGAYERYLRGMNASMRQKVALTAAYLLPHGTVADMGMGSGAGSDALAALYPALDVVGVDISDDMIEMARERYQRPNLRFERGDVAGDVFGEGAIDTIASSSVLHHVTSFNGYEDERAAEAIVAQARQLREGGRLIVRDFLHPGTGVVRLELPADDGDASDEPQTCSSAALFERFAREYRSLSAGPGFVYAERRDEDLDAGWRRFEVDLRHAVEFVLRKDYRRDWNEEVKEAYTYATQEEFESIFARAGLRVLASIPLRNPWIVRNRFEGKVRLADPGGAPLEHPATNYLIVGEKAGAQSGVRFREVKRAEPLGFLALVHFRHIETGEVRDLVLRPNRTLDILPWFGLEGDLFVLARQSYPRPVLCADVEGSIDGSRVFGYVSEPLSVIQTDQPLGTTVERALARNAGLSERDIVRFEPGTTYHPSPGGIQEEVRSTLVEIAPTFAHRPADGVSGFSTSGRVAAIEARQLLRAAQAGGYPDARLELNVYELLLSRGLDPGPWIGDAIEPAPGPMPRATATDGELPERGPRRRFERATRPREPFLELRCSTFEELDGAGRVIAEGVREYVVPRALGPNTVATALLRWHDGRAYLGIDDDDLPAAQSFDGRSDILVAPAWRLPRAIRSMTPATTFVRRRLSEEYGVEAGRTWMLGGRYYPSLGVTPEVVHPIAIEVVAEHDAGACLTWVSLDAIVRARRELRDGHLRIVSLRAAHVLGLLGGNFP